MTDSASAAFTPEPISDAEQRLMISTELGVIRDLVARGAFNRAGLQHVNHRLVLPAGRVSPADAAMTSLRETVISEVHAALDEATGISVDYWQFPHRIDVPDDISGLDPAAQHDAAGKEPEDPRQHRRARLRARPPQSTRRRPRRHARRRPLLPLRAPHDQDATPARCTSTTPTTAPATAASRTPTATPPPAHAEADRSPRARHAADHAPPQPPLLPTRLGTPVSGDRHDPVFFVAPTRDRQSSFIFSPRWIAGRRRAPRLQKVPDPYNRKERDGRSRC